jgi:hypothetical protein
MKDYSSEFLVSGFSTKILILATILQMSAIVFHKIRKMQIRLAVFSLCDAPLKILNADSKQRVYRKHTERGDSCVNTILIFAVLRTKMCIVIRSQIACLNKRTNVNWLLQNFELKYTQFRKSVFIP